MRFRPTWGGIAPSPSNQHENGTRVVVAIALLISIGALLRVGVFLISNTDPLSRQLEADSFGYLTLAASLQSGAGFARDVADAPTHLPIPLPELVRTPGYPAVIALLGALTGHGQPATILLQHLLNLIASLMAAVACYRLFGARAAVVVVLILTFDLQGIALSNLILTEATYGFTLLCVALVVSRLAIEPSWRLAFVAGGLLGVSTLLRPTSIALPALVGLGLVLHGLLKRQRKAIVAACIVALVGNVIEVSWIVRNGIVAGEYTLSTVARHNLVLHASGGLARAKGISNQTATDKLTSSLGITEPRIRFFPMSSTENAKVRTFAIDTIRRHKRAFLTEYVIRSINMLFGPDKQILIVLGLPFVSFGIHPPDRPVAATVPPLSWLLLGFQIAWLAAVYLLGLKTLLLAVRDGRAPMAVWICLSLATYVIVLSAGVPGDPRLRWPVIPLLAVVAAASLRSRCHVTS
jgi:hypothetical protein